MQSILVKGIVLKGRVEVAEPIDLPDGSEVTITGKANGKLRTSADGDRPMNSDEISATLAAMNKVEPFDMTDEERARADAWERKINDYTMANLDSGIKDVFR